MVNFISNFLLAKGRVESLQWLCGYLYLDLDSPHNLVKLFAMSKRNWTVINLFIYFLWLISVYIYIYRQRYRTEPVSLFFLKSVMKKYNYDQWILDREIRGKEYYNYTQIKVLRVSKIELARSLRVSTSVL